MDAYIAHKETEKATQARNRASEASMDPANQKISGDDIKFDLTETERNLLRDYTKFTMNLENLCMFFPLRLQESSKKKRK